MNGHFEIENTAYPIGYLTGTAGYKVTDMRNLKALHSHAIPKEHALRIASEANAKLRSKELELNDNSTTVYDFVAAEVAKL